MPEIPTEDLSNLLARIALRDRAAFRALYDATAPKLFAICLRLLRDRREAEDALQEVFVKIWHRADRFASGVSRPSAWLNAVARNHAIDRLRQIRAPHTDLDIAHGFADPSSGPEALAINSDDGRRIDDCMGRLAPERAEAIRLAYVEGESYLDLSERYQVPLNTLRTWLRRGLLQLRDCLGPAS
ncbi:RNA polymerase subunit sigma [Salipiger aestuarii]|uniref:sigma-70 family RNA polymerase sigma factor n=1 Tax=Salipiger aestuarii TaxID=568098 RepID=UPI00025B8B0E|nr:sigma-70 family RNA polymerase sigma factor [Salipiger aestuarii]EIE48795.1 RNA polymerase sigma factor [Citreicella sp. 357]KAA8610439.1 RNA polymerase subunit sigma [Salipiger aestuarii]KAA8616455.1 RNA polymerase subunit sigma [Salipiger aestuarii]